MLHEEIAGLDTQFRETIFAELNELRNAPPDEPLADGTIPVGREEERRGHALPNGPAAEEAPLGVDHEARSAERPLTP